MPVPKNFPGMNSVDTIAAMAGAIGGAVHGPSAFPADAVATVLAVNGLDLERRADALLALR